MRISQYALFKGYDGVERQFPLRAVFNHVGMRGGLGCYAVKGIDPVWVSQVSASVYKVIPVWMLDVAARNSKKFVIADWPSEIGDGSTVSDPTDHFQRSPAEMGAYYNTESNAVALVRRPFYPPSNGHLVSQKCEDQTTAHEMGHVLISIEDISRAFPFASMRDLDLLNKPSLPTPQYLYLSNDGEGCEETFCEATALALTGVVDTPDMNTHFCKTVFMTRCYYEYMAQHYDVTHPPGDFKALSDQALFEAERQTMLRYLIYDEGFRDAVDCMKRHRAAEQAGEDMPPDMVSHFAYEDIINRQGLDRVMEICQYSDSFHLTYS